MSQEKKRFIIETNKFPDYVLMSSTTLLDLEKEVQKQNKMEHNQNVHLHKFENMNILLLEDLRKNEFIFYDKEKLKEFMYRSFYS
ncbi:MAG: hypothetical protein PVI88_00350 [Nitrosopumilaceae archaeon]